MFWRGNTIVDLSRKFLNTNGVTQTAQAVITAPNPKEYYRAFDSGMFWKESLLLIAFKENLARLEVASQKVW